MIDEDSPQATSSSTSRFSFLRPQFCLKAFIGFMGGALCVGMLLSPDSELQIIAGISFIMSLLVGISGIVTGLIRWSRNDRSARRCTIMLMVGLLIVLLLLWPAL